MRKQDKLKRKGSQLDADRATYKRNMQMVNKQTKHVHPTFRFKREWLNELGFTKPGSTAVVAKRLGGDPAMLSMAKEIAVVAIEGFYEKTKASMLLDAFARAARNNYETSNLGKHLSQKSWKKATKTSLTFVTFFFEEVGAFPPAFLDKRTWESVW